MCRAEVQRYDSGGQGTVVLRLPRVPASARPVVAAVPRSKYWMMVLWPLLPLGFLLYLSFSAPAECGLTPSGVCTIRGAQCIFAGTTPPVALQRLCAESPPARACQVGNAQCMYHGALPSALRPLCSPAAP